MKRGGEEETSIYLPSKITLTITALAAVISEAFLTVVIVAKLTNERKIIVTGLLCLSLFFLLVIPTKYIAVAIEIRLSVIIN